MTDRSPKPQPPARKTAGPNPATGDDVDAAVEDEWRRIERERIAEEVEEAREDAIAEEAPPLRRWPWLAFVAALTAGVIAAVVLNSPAAISRRMVAPRQEPAAAEAAKPAVAAASDREELTLIVAGPEGRKRLAALLDASGIERIDGPDDDEQIRGAGIGEAGASIEDDRLEVAADPAAVEAFLAALRSQPDDSPIRLGSRQGPGGAPAAGPGGEESRVAPGGDSQAALRRLAIRLVADDSPEASPGPSPESLDE